MHSLSLRVEQKFGYLLDSLVSSMVLGTRKTLNTCMYHGSALKGKPPDIRLVVPTQFLSLDVMGSLILLDPDSG